MIYLIYDTETTSLIKNTAQSLDKQPHLLEFYGCLCDENGKVLEELEFMCNPGIEISEEVTKITGLKTEDVKNLPPFKEHFEKVKAFFAKAGAMVAHNLSYDSSIIAFEISRIKAEMKWPELKICTVEETEHIKGHRMSLGNLYEYLFAEPFIGAHRAKNDVMALKACFFKLKQQGEI